MKSLFQIKSHVAPLQAIDVERPVIVRSGFESVKNTIHCRNRIRRILFLLLFLIKAVHEKKCSNPSSRVLESFVLRSFLRSWFFLPVFLVPDSLSDSSWSFPERTSLLPSFLSYASIPLCALLSLCACFLTIGLSFGLRWHGSKHRPFERWFATNWSSLLAYLSRFWTAMSSFIGTYCLRPVKTDAELNQKVGTSSSTWSFPKLKRKLKPSLCFAFISPKCTILLKGVFTWNQTDWRGLKRHLTTQSCSLNCALLSIYSPTYVNGSCRPRLRANNNNFFRPKTPRLDDLKGNLCQAPREPVCETELHPTVRLNMLKLWMLSLRKYMCILWTNVCC